MMWYKPMKSVRRDGLAQNDGPSDRVVMIGTDKDGTPRGWDVDSSPVAVLAIMPGPEREHAIQTILGGNMEFDPVMFTLRQEEDSIIDVLTNMEHTLAEGTLGGKDPAGPRLVVLNLDIPDFGLLDDKAIRDSPSIRTIPSDTWKNITRMLKRAVDQHHITILVVTTNFNSILTPEWMIDYSGLRMSSGQLPMEARMVTGVGLTDHPMDGDDWIPGDPIEVQVMVDGRETVPFVINPSSHDDGDDGNLMNERTGEPITGTAQAGHDQGEDWNDARDMVFRKLLKTVGIMGAITLIGMIIGLIMKRSGLKMGGNHHGRGVESWIKLGQVLYRMMTGTLL